MTSVVAVGDVATQDTAAEEVAPSSLRIVTSRWLVIAVAAALALRVCVTAVLRHEAPGDELWYLVDVPVFAAFMVAGTHRRRNNELPINDRQVDWMIGVGISGLIMLIVTLLEPRVLSIAPVVLLGYVPGVMYLFVSCLLCFGTRPTMRFWLTWIALIAYWPIFNRLGGTALGGKPTDYAVVVVLYAVLAVAVAIGERTKYLLYSVGICFVVGIVVTIALHSSGVTLECVPSIFAVCAGYWSFLFLCRRDGVGRRGHNHLSLAYPHASPWTYGVVLAGAVLIALAPIATPALLEMKIPRVTPGASDLTAVPYGWTIEEQENYPWAARYYGPGATWTRYLVAPPSGSDFKESAIDVVTSPTLGALATFPAILSYTFSSPLEQATDEVKLDGGIVATLDYTNSLALATSSAGVWTLLSFVWQPKGAGGSYQRVSVSSLESSNAGVLPDPSPPFKSGGIHIIISDVTRGQVDDAGSKPPATAYRGARTLANDLISEQRIVGR